jgi:hypothetical protein
LALRTNVHRQVPAYEQFGVNEQVRGWLTIRYVDTLTTGYSPRRGDRIVKCGRRDTELYVMNVEPMGHYEGGHELYRLYFTDRRPGANAPDLG